MWYILKKLCKLWFYMCLCNTCVMNICQQTCVNHHEWLWLSSHWHLQQLLHQAWCSSKVPHLRAIKVLPGETLDLCFQWAWAQIPWAEVRTWRTKLLNCYTWTEWKVPPDPLSTQAIKTVSCLRCTWTSLRSKKYLVLQAYSSSSLCNIHLYIPL